MLPHRAELRLLRAPCTAPEGRGHGAGGGHLREGSPSDSPGRRWHGSPGSIGARARKRAASAGAHKDAPGAHADQAAHEAALSSGLVLGLHWGWLARTCTQYDTVLQYVTSHTVRQATRTLSMTLSESYQLDPGCVAYRTQLRSCVCITALSLRDVLRQAAPSTHPHGPRSRPRSRPCPSSDVVVHRRRARRPLSIKARKTTAAAAAATAAAAVGPRTATTAATIPVAIAAFTDRGDV